MIRQRLEVQGEVQGVGFRPQVARLASEHGVSGWVQNGPGGVLMELQGPEDAIVAVLAAVRALAPPVRIDRAVLVPGTPEPGEAGFAIRPSGTDGTVAHAVPPDLAICADCVAEVRDPADRRFDHGFASCTACGPRASIAVTPPFDRARTAMAEFGLCPACAAEYATPGDRRFHAQTTCCPRCGPRLTGSLDAAAACIAAGGLVGLRGIGGHQLLCDATDADAVARVRAAKERPHKPLAVMVVDLAGAEALAGPLSRAARAELTAPSGPIVVVPWHGGGLAPGVAPAGALGLMLPTTALHLRLLDRVGGPVVCTSGNRAGAPLPTDAQAARAALGEAIGAWLDHDRPILRPLDDSVVRIDGGWRVVLRRARGLAPRPLTMPSAPGAAAASPTVLAVGPHLHVAPALLRGDVAHVAPHVGNLDDRRTLARFDAEVVRLLAQAPGGVHAVACDLHPDLASTRRAERLAAELGAALVRVQHHHAHIAAVLAEHGALGPAWGLAWDGHGHGEDGTAWGGEVLAVDGGLEMRRVAGLRPLPIPGGDAAARAPARVALGMLVVAGLADDPRAAAVVDRARATLGQTTADGVAELVRRNASPLSSSMGRLFDAVAFVLGGPGRATHEAQAPAWLEHLAAGGRAAPLELPLGGGEPPRWDWRPLLDGLLDGLATARPTADLAAGFHAALAHAAVAALRPLPALPVALGGGCFGNTLLLDQVSSALSGAGRQVLTARALPPGDGGLALGQAILARTRLKNL